jgi:hypothetical protein
MKTAEIKRMTTSERLEAMEALWDSLIHDSADIKSPDWHSEVLHQRELKVKDGSTEFVSLNELKKRK